MDSDKRSHRCRCLYLGCSVEAGQRASRLRGLQRVVLGAVLAMTVLFFTYPDQLLNRSRLTGTARSQKSNQRVIFAYARISDPTLSFCFQQRPLALWLRHRNRVLGRSVCSRIFHVSPPAVGPESRSRGDSHRNGNRRSTALAKHECSDTYSCVASRRNSDGPRGFRLGS